MFAVAPTDINWFSQLRQEGIHGQLANFWTPTPWNITKLSLGNKLCFMLKSPIRKIGGYGHFYSYQNMKASIAWEKWCPGADSNHRHEDFQSSALPTELPGL